MQQRSFFLTRSYFTLTAILALFFGVLTYFPAKSQEVLVAARLDSNNVTIGDQVHLEFSIKCPSKYRLNLPVFPDSLGKVEVLKKLNLDTAGKDGDFLNFKQRLLITAFDSGNFTITAFKFPYKKPNDSSTYYAESDSLLFRVNSILVDTTKEIKDIKPPLDVPFSWKEFFKEYGLYIVGGIVLIALAIAFWYWWRRREKPVAEIKAAPKRPAHLVAMEKLDALEKQKLWQQGEVKAYHSELSDILRAYIEERYKIMALELTTDETIAALRQVPYAEKAALQQVLHLSDMVKFAKAQPLGTENEQSLSLARDFVRNTTLVEAATTKGEEEKA